MLMNLKVSVNFGKRGSAIRQEKHPFCSFSRIFNTNNLWINLPAVKRVIEEKTLHMEIIVNNKVMRGGEEEEGEIDCILFSRLWTKVLMLFNWKQRVEQLSKVSKEHKVWRGNLGLNGRISKFLNRYQRSTSPFSSGQNNIRSLACYVEFIHPESRKFSHECSTVISFGTISQTWYKFY